MSITGMQKYVEEASHALGNLNLVQAPERRYKAAGHHLAVLPTKQDLDNACTSAEQLVAPQHNCQQLRRRPYPDISDMSPLSLSNPLPITCSGSIVSTLTSSLSLMLLILLLILCLLLYSCHYLIML
jgi:hypothetical protein